MKPLKGNKKIDFLFEKGVRFSSEFVRCVFMKQESTELFYVVSVPKKSFSRAVDRNKIKRQLREILRKNDGLFKKRTNIFIKEVKFNKRRASVYDHIPTKTIVFKNTFIFS